MYKKNRWVDPVIRTGEDRNFCHFQPADGGMAMILYGSSVVIPQLAQQDLGYPPPSGAGAVARRSVDYVDHPAGAEADAGGADALDHRPVLPPWRCRSSSRTLTPDIDFETLVLFQRPVD